VYCIVLYCIVPVTLLRCIMREAVSQQSVCIWEAENNVEVGMA